MDSGTEHHQVLNPVCVQHVRIVVFKFTSWGKFTNLNYMYSIGESVIGCIKGF